MIILLKIIVDLICGVLFWWGGYSWHNARRFLLPCVIAILSCFLLHSLIGLLSLAAIGMLCLGYGDKSPLRRIFGNSIGRGIWGLLCAIGISLGLFLSGHILWFFWVAYLILNFCGEAFLNKIPQWIGDPIFGIFLGSIVFLIK